MIDLLVPASVGGPAPGSGTGTGAGSGNGSGSGATSEPAGGLAETGLPALPVTAVGAGLLLLGLAGHGLSRRRAAG